MPDLPVLHGREHEKKEIQREKIQQVEELLKSCSAEQLENICQFVQKVQDNGSIDKMQADIADRLFANWKTPIMNRIPQEEWSRVLSMLPGEKKYYKPGEILWNHRGYGHSASGTSKRLCSCLYRKWERAGIRNWKICGR